MKKTIVLSIALILSMLLSACTIEPKNQENESIITKSKTLAESDDVTTINILVPKSSSLYENEIIASALSEKINLNYLDSELDSIDTEYLKMELMKRSSEIDIFMVNSNDVFAREVVENGLYYNLLEDINLKKYYDMMYPQVSKWCTDDTEFFGFPHKIQLLSKLNINRIMMDEGTFNSYDLLSLKSLDEFSTGFEDIRYNYGVGINIEEYIYHNISSFILSNYNVDNLSLDFSYDDLHLLLNKANELKDAVKKDITSLEEMKLDSNNKFSYNRLAKEYIYLSPIYVGSFNSIYAKDIGIISKKSPELIDGFQIDMSIELSYYVINPYSKNINTCLDIVNEIGEMSRYYSKNMTSLIYKDYNSTFMEIEDMKAYGLPLTNKFNNQLYFDESGELYNNHDVYFPFYGYKIVLDACYQYLDGEVTFDETIKIINKQMDILQKETVK